MAEQFGVNREFSYLSWVEVFVSTPFVSMKSSIIFGLAVGAAAISDAAAQGKEAPDALYYTDPGKLRELRSLQIQSDSIARRYQGLNFDSIRIQAQGNIEDLMPNGILLDNRSESDSYIHNGTRYYIRNMKPKIEPKAVSPGSNIYRLK